MKIENIFEEDYENDIKNLYGIFVSYFIFRVSWFMDSIILSIER
jgi:hypothetical protein